MVIEPSMGDSMRSSQMSASHARELALRVLGGRLGDVALDPQLRQSAELRGKRPPGVVVCHLAPPDAEGVAAEHGVGEHADEQALEDVDRVGGLDAERLGRGDDPR